MDMNLHDLVNYFGLFVVVFGMAWTDGIDRATGYIVTATNWNDLIGAAGSLMQLKSHAHGGTTGEGSQSLGPLVKATFTDAAAPAAPAAGQTSIYTVSAKPRYRANGGADRAIITDETTAAGDLAGTYPSPTVSKLTIGSDANGDIYYRAAGVLARLGIGSAGQFLVVNGGATAPQWTTSPFSTAEAKLGADVTMTSAGTYYDGPSISLVAGTWMIWAAIVVGINSSIAGAHAEAKLWDGTTVLDSDEVKIYLPSGGLPTHRLVCIGFVVLGSTTSYKISAISGSANGVIYAATLDNGAGNNASHIMAVKLA